VFVELVLPLRKEIPSDAFDRIDAAANLVRAGDAPLVFGVDSIICPLELAAVDFDDAAKLLERGGELLLRIGLCIARVRHAVDEDVALLDPERFVGAIHRRLATAEKNGRRK